MDNKSLISEEIVKNMVQELLSEETSKVKRDDFNRVQYKVEELQNSLGETIKELRKLEDSIPNGLKTLSGARVNSISINLSGDVFFNIDNVFLTFSGLLKFP